MMEVRESVPAHLSGGLEGRRHRPAEQEGIYDAVFPSSTPHNSTGTLCPVSDKIPYAENILKTKGKKTDFSETKLIAY
jgi:hypothetical protein